jgi:hypothetical protein
VNGSERRRVEKKLKANVIISYKGLFFFKSELSHGFKSEMEKESTEEISTQ